MTTETEPAPESSPAPAPMTLGARLLNVVAAPGELFDALRSSRESAANWLVPALIYIVVGWLGATVILSQDWVKPQVVEMQAAGLQKQVASGKMSQAQADKARDALERYGMLGVTVSSYAGPLVLGLAGPFLWGLLLWLVGSKILRGGFSYMKAVEIAGLTAVIAALGAAARTLLVLIQGHLMAAFNLALLIGDYDPSNLLHAYAGLLDGVIIWGLAVKSFGVARVAGRPVLGVAVWVFSAWFLFVGGLVTLGWLLQRLLT